MNIKRKYSDPEPEDGKSFYTNGPDYSDNRVDGKSFYTNGTDNRVNVSSADNFDDTSDAMKNSVDNTSANNLLICDAELELQTLFNFRLPRSWNFYSKCNF